jgi:F-type H+-transporting ATPase subunit gamma
MASSRTSSNRIASVKATQKITKAMQMVAAAKLRRAQEAAEAARPYAERMDAVLANLAARLPAAARAALLAGTGKDQVHLLVVAPPSAACAAASTPTSSSRAREARKS